MTVKPEFRLPSVKHIPVERAVLDGFEEMRLLDPLAGGEVGDGAGGWRKRSGIRSQRSGLRGPDGSVVFMLTSGFWPLASACLREAGAGAVRELLHRLLEHFTQGRVERDVRADRCLQKS